MIATIVMGSSKYGPNVKGIRIIISNINTITSGMGAKYRNKNNNGEK